MPVKIAAGFGALCIFERAQMLGLAMSNTIDLGRPITLSPLGLLAGRPKIHNVSHSRLDGNRIQPANVGHLPKSRLQIRRHLCGPSVLKASVGESKRLRLLLWAKGADDFNTRLVDRNSF